MVKKLIELKIDVNRRNVKTGNTALHIACKLENIQIIKHLLDGGANFKTLNRNKDSPLSIIPGKIQILLLF